MKRLISVACIACAATLAGCSEEPASADAGVDAGAQGASLDKLITDMCGMLDQGYRKKQLWRARACGVTIDEAEIGHIMSDSYEVTGEIIFGIPLSVDDTVSGLGILDELSCKGQYATFWANLKPSLQAGRVKYDAQAFAACQAAAAASTPGYGPRPAAICDEIFVPNQAEGQPCSYSFDCADGNYCKPDDTGLASCSGKCARPLVAGATCTERDVCEDNSFCDPATLKCTALPRAGTPCLILDNTGYCASDSSCNVDVDPPTCAAYKSVGEGCTDHYDCEGVLLCIALKCAEPPKPAEENEACGGETFAYCNQEKCLFCKQVTDTTGVCTAMPKPGEACSGPAKVCAGDDQVGQAVVECDSTNVCKVRPRNGEACTVALTADDDPNVANQGNCMYLDSFCKRASAAATTGICTASTSQKGGPCGDRYDLPSYCATNAYCKVATSAQGTCTDLEADDAPCIDGSECTSGYCKTVSGADAGTQVKQCGQRDGVGQTCSSNDTCASGYCAVTVTDAGVQPGLCALMPVADQACGGPDQDICADGLYCKVQGTTTTCLAKKGAGQACAAESECESGVCGMEGKCAQDCSAGDGGAGFVSCRGGYLSYFEELLFFAGALVFFGRRRGKKE